MNGDESPDFESDPPQPANSQRAALVGLIIVVVLALGGLLLVRKLKAMSELQDCVMQGRTNCAPAGWSG